MEHFLIAIDRSLQYIVIVFMLTDIDYRMTAAGFQQCIVKVELLWEKITSKG